MKLRTRIAALAAATAIALTGLTTLTASAADADVYTVPGGHLVNNRLWNTECEPYSSTVVRCRTEIFAKTVVREGDRYISANHWVFNNLTYLPSSRAQWKGNPLAAKGEFTSGGRQWRTDCDSPATGRGACRSYAKTNFVAEVNGRYITKNDWVFNNIVRFAEGGVAPVTKVPAHVLDQSVLDFTGFGPIKIGARFDQLSLLGYAMYGQAPDQVCEAHWSGIPSLTDRGIDPGTGGRDASVFMVSLTKPGPKTADGPQVGMTVGQIKALYGSDFTVVTKTNHGQTQYFGSVREGNRELVFRAPDGGEFAPTRPLRDSDVIAEITATTYGTDVSMDGC